MIEAVTNCVFNLLIDAVPLTTIFCGKVKLLAENVVPVI